MATISGKKVEYRAVGRRKAASARVKLDKGDGKFVVNGRPMEQYFPHFEAREIILAPLKALAKEKDFDITVRVIGGGVMGQADAVRHGLARALVLWNEEWKKTLKTGGFLTRDPRGKERKKPGLKRARKAAQWSKR